MAKKLKDITPEMRGMLRSLSDRYSSVFLVDLTTKEYIAVKTPFAMGSCYNMGENFERDLTDLLDKGAKPEYHDEIMKYLEISTLQSRLADVDILEAIVFESSIPGHDHKRLSVKAGYRIPDGRCVLVFITVHDLDREKIKQAKLLKEINEIVDVSQMGVWKTQFCNGVSSGLHASPKMQELMGLEIDSLTPEQMQAYWYSRVPEKNCPLVQRYFANLIAGGRDEVLYAWNHPTLGERYVRCGGIGYKVSDTVTNMYGYHYDVTESVLEDQARQKALEEARKQAEAANAAKTSFLFSMSHDIRTPMNAIIGFAELLRKHQDEPEKRKDYLDKIESSSAILLSILDNVLEMARIEKGAVIVEEVPTSVEIFRDTVYSIFCDQMKNKGIEFTLDIDVEHPYIYGDITKIREVYINLVSNAYKYTLPGGKISICLKEVPYDREGYVLYKVTVADTGIGMSEEFLPHLFDEFTRENNTTDNKIAGTGLGMAIVKRLLSLMNGTIDVVSRKGEGTTFTVMMPHRIADKESLGLHEDVDLQPEQFSGKRILLAEDNDLNAEIAIDLLSEVGFIIDRAEDGRIAYEKVIEAEEGYYDAILMDVQMPNMNGYEATRAIRAIDGSKGKIPILAMTANAFEEDKRESLNAGMCAHLTKPINIPELLKTLAAFTL